MADLEDFATRARFVARQASVDRAAVEAMRALEQAGLQVLLLKGPVLSRTLYRPHEQRGYFDIDLLVAPSGLQSAREVLTALGYKNVSKLYGVDDIGGVLHAESWAKAVDGFGNFTIDLHWRLDGCAAPPEPAFWTLYSERDAVEIEGERLRTLPQEGLALHLALHAAQHGTSDQKAMGDLERGLERWPPSLWRKARELASRLDALDAFAAGLRLLHSGESLADELGLPDADATTWAIANRELQPRGTFHLKALSEARGIRDRVRVIRRALFPSRAWIRWELRWTAKGRARLFAGYVVHVARAPAWAIRAWQFRRRERREIGRGAD
jgi:hypothetical protein